MQVQVLFPALSNPLKRKDLRRRIASPFLLRLRCHQRAPNKCPTLQNSQTFNFAFAMPVYQAMRDSVNPGGPKSPLEQVEMNRYSIRVYIYQQSP